MELPTTFWVLVAIAAIDGLLMLSWVFFKGQRAKGKGQNSDSQIEQKSWEVLHGAIKKGQEIVGEAEIESIKSQSSMIKEVQDFEKKYESEMGATASAVQKQLLAETAKATEEFKQGLVKQLTQLREISQGTEETINRETEQMVAKFGSDLNSKLAEVEAKSLAAADSEVAAAKKVIADYQAKRMEQIDSEAVEVFEQAMKIIISKDLSESVHVELIKEALEEAKKEKFI